MTPSFLSLEERLFYALAPTSVQTALTKSTLEPSAFLRLSETNLRKYGLPPKGHVAWLRHKTTCRPNTIVSRCIKESIEILFPDDPRWPHSFTHLARQAPAVLFLRGQIAAVPWIAIVGTRKPTSYGERATAQLVEELARHPIGIVSGLALGTDGRAHAEALKHRLPTLAVLGSSVGKTDIYPRSHTRLAQTIVDQGGGLLSELPPGELMHEGAFPARNRLIAALCRAVIVIEARERSGTLITARIALELGREVLAVPGSIFSDASKGTHTLIQAGAHLCQNAQDVWCSLAIDPPTETHITRTNMQLRPEDRRLFELLTASDDGLDLDTLAEALHIHPNTLGARLGLLELQGLVQQTGSGRWLLCRLA